MERQRRRHPRAPALRRKRLARQQHAGQRAGRAHRQLPRRHHDAVPHHRPALQVDRAGGPPEGGGERKHQAARGGQVVIGKDGAQHRPGQHRHAQSAQQQRQAAAAVQPLAQHGPGQQRRHHRHGESQHRGARGAGAELGPGHRQVEHRHGQDAADDDARPRRPRRQQRQPLGARQRQQQQGAAAQPQQAQGERRADRQHDLDRRPVQAPEQRQRNGNQAHAAFSWAIRSARPWRWLPSASKLSGLSQRS